MTTAAARLREIVDNYADPPTDPAEIAPLLIAAGAEGRDRTELYGHIQHFVGRSNINAIWYDACNLETVALKED